MQLKKRCTAALSIIPAMIHDGEVQAISSVWAV